MQDRASQSVEPSHYQRIVVSDILQTRLQPWASAESTCLAIDWDMVLHMSYADTVGEPNTTADLHKLVDSTVNLWTNWLVSIRYYEAL